MDQKVKLCSAHGDKKNSLKSKLMKATAKTDFERMATLMPQTINLLYEEVRPSTRLPGHHGALPHFRS